MAVAALGRVVAEGGPDGNGSGSNDPPGDVELELAVEELATRLAPAADMAGEGGLEVGIDVAGRGTTSSGGCGSGIGAEVGVPFSGS
jgi:hypothetical protein